eukprot:GCRY01003011.1.p1 GENE.GCRY01003011.1~~GCRY01003011.1.p1  ORF type:complete len:802 (-),score=205.61 GCRY01003011.1:623-3028(-)
MDELEEKAILVVQDFLSHHSFLQTLEQFEREYRSLKGDSSKFPLIELEKDAKNVETLLLQSFNDGDEDTFFSLFEQFFPIDMRASAATSSLEFLLHVHFAIFPLRYENMERKEREASSTLSPSMKRFKVFLERRKTVAVTELPSEHLSYFALPYIPNPHTNPTYQHLFTPLWLDEVRSRLRAAIVVAGRIGRAEKDQKEVPELLTLIQSGGQSGLQRSRSHKNDFADTSPLSSLSLSEAGRPASGQGKEESITPPPSDPHRSESRRSSYASSVNTYTTSSSVGVFGLGIEQLEVELDKAIRLCGDFAASLELAVSGRMIEQSYLGGLSERLHSLQSIHQAHGRAEPELRSDDQPFPNTSPSPFDTMKPLDFARVKKAILGPDTAHTILLLQALRWHISRAPTPFRLPILNSFISGDVLGCVSDHSYLASLLQNPSALIVEYTTRLVNTLASDVRGRTYLLNHPQILVMLRSILLAQQSDNTLLQSSLSILQKFSLRRLAQEFMIAQGLIREMVRLLAEPDQLSDFTLEYATALLMNLSLRSEGRRCCESLEDGKDALCVLNDLLEHENFQVRTYINGTLYSLLKSRVLRERARAMGLEEILKYVMDNCEPALAQQLEYIQTMLFAEDGDIDESESDVEGEPEDYEESEGADDASGLQFEDDIDETYAALNDEVCGEDLLVPFVSATTEVVPSAAAGPAAHSIFDMSIIKEETTMELKAAQTTANRTRTRPITPNLRQSQSLTHNRGFGLLMLMKGILRVLLLFIISCSIIVIVVICIKIDSSLCIVTIILIFMEHSRNCRN